MTTQPYYLTTPIYYVNDRPHIGHCYTTLVADVMARFQRLWRGQTQPAPTDQASVFFLTGTDEHADKVVKSAAEHGKGPQEWADINAAEFVKAFASLGIANDDFIRTSEPRHKDKVPGYISRLMASGDIYKGEYTGWYDEGQEAYVPENEARENDYKSKISKKPLVKRTEACYFFRLGKYQQRLHQHIEQNPGFVQPDARRQEVLGRLRPPAELFDIPVSRPVTNDPATQWGVRVPGDEANRVYVWIDALFNYLTVVDTPERRRLWPAAVHLIGKDILWFHAVIWPALLMALNEPLPGTIFGHGWWISEGEKMSKSMGNFIDLEKLHEYAAKFGLDGLRWFLATQGPLSGSDADFSHARFVEVYNTDLANAVGNCVSRVGNMVEKYFGGSLPANETVELVADPAAGATIMQPLATLYDWKRLSQEAVGEVAKNIGADGQQGFDPGAALLAGAKLVRHVDAFIGLTRPFTVAKRTDDQSKRALAAILYQCAETLRVASVILSPALTTKIPQLWQAWGCQPPAGTTLANLCEWGGHHALKPGQKVGKGEILYMRADGA
ncbi:MAG: methionine--tRNA ligase [Tepidisphaera sp.]|nr:methionine--tRNA ligase [Tepidisphaera sp.]